MTPPTRPCPHCGKPVVMTHPTRDAVLKHLKRREASPREIAVATGEPLGNVSYHVRVLHDSGVLELVRTEPRRGAVEHFYRLVKR